MMITPKKKKKKNEKERQRSIDKINHTRYGNICGFIRLSTPMGDDDSSLLMSRYKVYHSNVLSFAWGVCHSIGS
jgi:hypothetical protein